MKKLYDQAIDSDIKRYEEIRKLTTGPGEYYTNGYLLDYDNIRNHYRLIAVDLSKQKELDADRKAFQQKQFLLVNLEVVKLRLKFSQGNTTVL